MCVAPAAAPLDVGTQITSRRVILSWPLVDCLERNGVITGYTVEFREEGGAMIPGEVEGQTFTARGLTPHTNYTFRVAGVNSNGTGPFSDIFIISTKKESKLWS